MTRNKDLKRLIRARMARTGESYTVARAHILQQRTFPPPPSGDRPPASMPPPAVERHEVRVRIRRSGRLDPYRARPTPANWLSLALPLPVLIIILAVMLAGCTAERDPPGPPAVDLDGSAVHVFDVSASLASVLDLDVADDGSMLVLNSVAPLFITFDTNGVEVAARGRAGGGPEEFGVPAGFVVRGIGGETWVFDSGRHALIRAPGATAARREIQLPADAIPPGAVPGTNPASPLVRLERWDGEVILPRRRPGELDIAGYWESVWSADLVALGLETGAVRLILALGEVLGDPSGQFDLRAGPLPFPLWYRLWTVCPSDGIRVYDRVRNQVRGFTAAGTEIDAISLPEPELDAVDPRDFALVIFDLLAIEALPEVPAGGISTSSADSARLIRDALPRITGTPTELARLLPRYVDIHCDEAGNLWIQRFDVRSPGPLMGGLRGSRRWLQVTPGGETREVRMPARFDPYRFTRERIWGIRRDSADVPSVAWIAAP